MHIKPYLFGVLVLAIFLSVIIAFQAAGFWSTSGKTSSSGEAVQPSAEDVNTIKGWMTFEQISTTYHAPLADILTQFDLPADTPASTAIKDLESDVFSVTNLRDWLQSRMQPAQPDTASTPGPQTTPTPVVTPAMPAASPLPTEHVAADKNITGKTTFQELLDWGVPEEAIRGVFDGDLPTFSSVIKDYVTQKGKEFSPIKAALQAEVDKTK
jgi:hypothetical protein